MKLRRNRKPPRVRRFTLQPGEIVVITYPDKVDQYALMMLSLQIQRQFPELMGRIMLLDGGIDINIIQPTIPDQPETA